MIDFKDMADLNSTEVVPGIDPKSLNQLFNDSQDADPQAMKGLVAAAKTYGIEKDEVKKQEGKLKKRKSDLREKELELFDMFQDVGITSIKTGGLTYFTRVDTYASVDSSNVETAFKWVDEIGCDFLIVKGINGKSLMREIKSYVEGGGDTPGIEQGIKLRTENRVSAPKR